MRFTYLVNIEDLDKTYQRFEKRTKYAIKKCRENVYISDDIDEFNRLHLLSRPDRKIDFDFIKKTYLERQPNCRIYATETAMAMISWDKEENKKAIGYYLLAGRNTTIKPDNSPSKILWEAMKDLNKIGINEIDLCGANKPNIELFKRGFSGKKVPQIEPCLKY